MAGRWPHWVYGTGDEPDYRFSFANERTFLAWIRTALALLAGGVALDAIDLQLPDAAKVTIAALLITLGLLCAAVSWVRWAKAERAMRQGAPLPTSMLTATLAGAIVVTALAVLVIGI